LGHKITPPKYNTDRTIRAVESWLYVFYPNLLILPCKTSCWRRIYRY